MGGIRMKTQARVVVIGGGVAGASTLYHLTKLGWSDVVLVDKNELTSGSTWMASGNVPQFARSYNLTKIHDYPVKLYPTLEAETEQHTGWKACGSLRIALVPERMLEFKHVHMKDKTLGINSYLVAPEEMKKIHPLIEPRGILGGLFHPEDGQVDPAGVTQALAQGARRRGAEIYRFNPVKAITRSPSGEWIVHTEKGTITCEYVVNCAGLWAPIIGAMVGLRLPIIPMEHQHILFGDVPELKGTGLQLPLLRDPDSSYYMRQEMAGVLIGPYELDPKAWHPQGVPLDYAAQSLPPDLDRINDVLTAALERVPALKNVGIQQKVNGPITYTPDATPLVGPAFGLPDFFINAGHCFGITECAAYGLYTAQWIIAGEPGIDLGFADPRRFGDYANYKYTYEKCRQAYRMMYAIEFPHEERPAARNIKTGPIFDLLKKQGAAFGQTYGWERPLWFAPEGMAPEDKLTFKRSNWHEPVGRECRLVREAVAVLDLSGFSKYEVSGPGAEAFLDYLCANSLPTRIGRIKVTPMLTPRGTFKCDLTITRLGPDRFYVVSAAAAEKHDLDWMLKRLPAEGGVTIENVTYRYGALVLAGPRSREVLAKLTETDMSNQAFPYLTLREIMVGPYSTRALRIGFVGELGWELHHPLEYQRGLYQAIMEAGREFGIGNFGLRALVSLRLEKGYIMLGGEISSERTPLEAGLDRFIDFNKGDFIGRQALLNQKEKGISQRLSLMIVESDDADCLGDEPVFRGEKIVGRVASGGYGHVVGASLASGYLDLDAAGPGTELEIAVFGDRRRAVVVPSPYYDQNNEKLRS
ncbi:MAG: FAD-dependent oxidoreductase [Thermodesulfobacteriota bacterium]